MSFTGSILLAGVGGFLYKYDQNQKYVQNPNVQFNLKEYGDKVLMEQLNNLTTRFTNLLLNFFPDFINGTPYVYPFKGLVELFSHRKEYVHILSGALTSYLIMFTVVLFIYWPTIGPIYFTFLAILGPIGFVVAGLHCVLQANMLTMLFMRTSHLSNSLVRTCMYTNNFVAVNVPDPIKYYVPIRSQYFWLIHLPMKMVKYFLGLLILITLLSISILPVIGPFIFHLIISPFITKVYFSKFLRLRGLSNTQKIGRAHV